MSEEHPQNPPSAPERGSSGHQHGHSHLPKFTFLEELKRRNVGRVAILYIILGYVVLETFGVFVHLLDLPPWVGRSAVLLVVLGFPVALLIAWIYEITPEGLKPTDEVAPHQSIRHLTGRRLDRAIIAVLAVALAYFVIDKFWLSSHKAVAPPVLSTHTTPAATVQPVAATPENSIAVLPFVDMSEKHDQEYFSDGLSEELIDQLAKMPGLKVIARTSSFSFKGKPNTVGEIARVLRVTHVLEGSVRKSGNKIRVTAQLVRADNGYHLWSETYERTLVDVFATEDDISRAVLGALKISLSNDGPATGHQPSSEAYDFYLQGRALEFEKDTVEKKIALLKKAVDADPNFARAWAGLAFMLSASVGQNWRSRSSTANEARNAIQHAVALAPNGSKTHEALCIYHDAIEWDREAALRECETRVQVDPGNSDALTALASLLIEVRGDSPRVRELYLKAIDIDPVNDNAYYNFGSYLVNSGRLEEGERAIRRFLQLDPTSNAGYSFLAEALILQGKVDEALSESGKIRDPYARLLSQSLAYCKKRAPEAAAAVREFDARFGEANPYDSATLHAFCGETDRALAKLQQAVSRSDGSVFWMGQDILLRSLHDDPRFKALLKKVNLPE
jgi:TolB-like protein/Tfp pilus assembly protein PilF